MGVFLYDEDAQERAIKTSLQSGRPGTYVWDMSMDTSKILPFLDSPGLQHISTDEKENIKRFLTSPGKDEFFYLLQLIGKTPAQVRNLLIDEFVRRFDLAKSRDTIALSLSAQHSWRQLEDALGRLCRSLKNDAHLQFWKKMRYVVEALPKRSEYSDKKTEAEAHRTARSKNGWSFTTCKLCWRRVAYNPGHIRKNANYCFAHNLPAAHPVYKKLSRMARDFSHEQQACRKRILEIVQKCSSGGDFQQTMLDHILQPNECLPRLAAYLQKVGHDGTAESLLWAFHGPREAIKDRLYLDALGEYIQNTLNAKDVINTGQPAFIFSIDELSRAETWLSLLDHDGRPNVTRTSFR